MPDAMLERNLFALMRVDEPLARVLIKYGGGQRGEVRSEHLDIPQPSPSQRVHLAGVIDPEEIHRWCSEGALLTVYCDRIEELLFILDDQDFRQSIFSGNLVLRLGVWRFTNNRSETDKLIATPSYLRTARWAERAAALSEKPKVIVADGGLFVDDVGEAFAELNYCPNLVNLDDLPQEQWPTQSEISVSMVFSVNDRRGFEVFAKSMNAEGLVWQIDPDLNEDRTEIAKNLFIGWYKPLSQREGQRRYLPLAANPKRRMPRSEQCSGVSFVGSSMRDTGVAYRRRFQEYLCSLGVGSQVAQERIQNFCEQICDERDAYSRELVLEHFPELGNGITKIPTQELGVDTTIWLGEYLAWQWRFKVVGSLKVPVNVWGDHGWNDLRSEHIQFHGRCGHGEALSKVYGQSLINLDIGRVYQQEIVTMRVFDVLASKRFILTPDTPAVSELFVPDREIATYKSLEELKEKIDYFLKYPERACEIAEAGHLRVLNDHQIVQRIDTLTRWALR